MVMGVAIVVAVARAFAARVHSVHSVQVSYVVNLVMFVRARWWSTKLFTPQESRAGFRGGAWQVE